MIEASGAARERAAAEVRALQYEERQLAGILGEQRSLLADVEAGIHLAGGRHGDQRVRLPLGPAPRGDRHRRVA